MGAAANALNRRLSLSPNEYNDVELESLYGSRGQKRARVFSQPDEPAEFDAHAEAHERGLHPSQYSQEDASTNQLLLSNGDGIDEDPFLSRMMELRIHVPYSNTCTRNTYSTVHVYWYM